MHSMCLPAWHGVSACWQEACIKHEHFVWGAQGQRMGSGRQRWLPTERTLAWHPGLQTAAWGM